MKIFIKKGIECYDITSRSLFDNIDNVELRGYTIPQPGINENIHANKRARI
jgi:hypothetical protein